MQGKKKKILKALMEGILEVEFGASKTQGTQANVVFSSPSCMWVRLEGRNVEWGGS